MTESAEAIPHHSYMRSTLNAVPTTNSILSKSKLPFALVLSPYRTPKNPDVRLPTAYCFEDDFCGADSSLDVVVL